MSTTIRSTRCDYKCLIEKAYWNLFEKFYLTFNRGKNDAKISVK